MEIELIYRWINFFLFLGMLGYFLREPLRDFLGDRSETIRKRLEEVAIKLKEMELRLQECQKRLAGSDQEIKELREELLREGELEKQALIHKAQSYAEKIRIDAKRMGEQELHKAKISLRQQTLKQALDLTQTLLQQAVETKDQERLTLWGIRSLGDSTHERASFS